MPFICAQAVKKYYNRLKNDKPLNNHRPRAATVFSARPIESRECP